MPDTDPDASVGEDSPPAGEAPKVYDEKFVKDLRKEAASYRTKGRETETALTAALSDLDALKASIPDLESRASTSEAKALRYEVALEAGISRTLADRLRGDDADALKADAEALRKELGGTAPVTHDQGTLPPPAAPKSINDALRALSRG